MLSPTLLQQLRDVVGPEHVAAGATDAEVYSYDASLALQRPDAVVFPADTAQVSQVVRLLAAAEVPFVPRGFGTNLSGGSVVAERGVILALARLNRLLRLEPENRCAVVQSGVTNLELQQALAPVGFEYKPDPASQKVSTLGGNVAENSGGPHCLKYGVTTNHVLGLTVVLPEGEVVQFGGTASDAPGLDLRGLMIGSEGTLGIVTEVVVRVVPQPEDVKTLLVIYDDLAAAARTVSDLTAAGIVPATLEMMDAPIMRAVEESMGGKCGYPLDAAAVLIIEVDGPAAGLAQQAAKIAHLCERNGCREVRAAKSEAERDLLWQGRRGAFGAIARLAPSYLVNDCTVPRSRLPEALARVGEIAKEHGLADGNVFHAGDGNLHPLLLFDSRDAEQLHQVHQAGQQIMEACVALGGTISGEHGIGTEKREAMRLVCSEDDLDFQRAVKRAFDPKNLLNPGKILPEPEAVPRKCSALAHTEAVDGVYAPATDSEAAAAVRQAVAAGTALTLCGAVLPTGTSANGRAILSSARLQALRDLDAENQTVTAQAGMSLAALQHALAEHRQWVPLRPPLAEQCSLGGVVALNASGPECLRYGAPRDLLLGLKFVSGQGKLLNAGGRVVKNVTGYDLTRLLCGSAGSLGFLTEVTLRTLPLPECSQTVEAVGAWTQCADAAARLLLSNLDPTSLTASAEAESWRLTVCFQGFEVTVADQCRRANTMLAECGLAASDRVGGEAGEVAGEQAVPQALDRVCSRPSVIRFGTPLAALRDLVPQVCAETPGLELLVDFGCGRVLAGGQELSADGWHRLRERAHSLEGYAVVVRSATANFDPGLDQTDKGAKATLLLRLKEHLDPHGVFAASPLSHSCH